MRNTTPLLALALLAAPFAACGGSETGSTTMGTSSSSSSSSSGSGGGGGHGGHDAGIPPVVCTPGPAPVMVNGFARSTIDDAAVGPAFATVADVNGDGKTDVVVAAFGTYTTMGGISLDRGTVTAYLQGEGENCWQKVPIVTQDDGFYFPNQVNLVDIDGDGDLDLIVPAGFFVCAFDNKVSKCGALAWFENDAGKWVRHDVVPSGAERFYHKGIFADVDGDGIADLVTISETASSGETVYYKGTKDALRFATTPTKIGDGGGALPFVYDLDGDGDLDVGSAQYFAPGESFVWFENTGGAWARHALDATSGKSIMIEAAPNLYGDGKLRLLGSNHTNTATTPTAVESAVFVFEPTADPKAPWTKTAISTGIVSRPGMGQGAPGVIGHGDVDGDGDLDVVVSGDGDARTFWLEQTAPGMFTTHVIEDKLGQAGGALVVDLDGDGKNEVVFSGYEDNKVYLYRLSK